jgi:hypothetical protein
MPGLTPKKRVLFKHTIVALLLGVFLAVWGSFFANRVQTVPTVNAATASTINFQARLLQSSGALVPDGNYHIEFKLYNAVTSSGSSQGSCTGDANCLWTETRTTGNLVTVSNGYFTVNLGSVTALPNINWNQELWLTMNVGGSGGSPSYDGEMSPRLKLTAVPYAFTAGSLTQTSGSNTNSLQLATPTGNATFTIQAATTGSYDICTTAAVCTGYAASTGSGNYIQNQNASAQATSNFWISGTGRADTALQAPLLQTPDVTGASTAITLRSGNSTSSGATGTVTIASGNATSGNSGNISLDVGTATGGTKGTVSIGTANASAVTVGNSSGNTTINGSAASTIGFGNFGVAASGAVTAVGVNSGAGLIQGTNGLTLTGATNINTSGSSAINIGTGSYSGTIAIGNSTSGGAIGIGSASGVTLTATAPNSAFAAAVQVSTTSASSTNGQRGLNVYNTITGGGANVFTGIVGFASSNSATLGGASLIGITGQAEFSGTGSENVLYGLQGTVGNNNTGTVATTSALYASNPYANSGTITNNYGLYVANQTAGTSNYGIWIQGASTDALYISGGASYFGGSLTAVSGATISGAAINLNDSSNFATNINTGGSTGTVTIGATSGTGTQSINIGTNAIASSTTNVTLGSTIGTSSTTIQSGSSNINLMNNTLITGNLTFVTGATRTIKIADGVSAAGNTLAIQGGAGASAPTTSFAGSQVTLTGGTGGISQSGGAGGAGGAVTIQGGGTTAGNWNGAVAGAVNINGGVGGSYTQGVVATGGAINLTAGRGGNANGFVNGVNGSPGGVITIVSGAGGNAGGASVSAAGGNSGDLTIQTGAPGTGINGGAAGVAGSIRLGTNGSVTNLAIAGADGTIILQSTSSSAAAFQVRNTSGNGVLTVDNSANQVLLGKTSTLNGTLQFANSAGANTVGFSLQANPASSYTLLLPTTGPTTSQCLGTDASVAVQLQFVTCGSSSGLAKNAADTSTAAVTATNFLYTFTNSSSAVNSGVLKIDNGNNTGSALSVVGSILQKTTTNSVVAFQLQNSAGTNLILADTSDQAITLLSNNGETSGNIQWTTNSNNLCSSLIYAKSVTLNGYVYYMGGGTAYRTSDATTVCKGKINADGSIGTLSTTTGLPAARQGGVAVTVNGYIYYIGGEQNGTDKGDIYYAKPSSADGTISAWTTNVSALPQTRVFASGLAANGYIYLFGGYVATSISLGNISVKPNADGSIPATWTTLNSLFRVLAFSASTSLNGYVYLVAGNYGSNIGATEYATLNADGTVGTFAEDSTNVLPSSLLANSGLALSANGYIYYVGGSDATSTSLNTVYYTKPTGTSGDITAWSTSTKTMPDFHNGSAGFVANGYLYSMGGLNNTAATNTIFYTSTARLSIGGSIDLVGSLGPNGDLAGTNSGAGSITVGNGTFVGSLQVNGAASIGGTLTTGATTVNGGLQVQNGTGGSVIGVDTTNTNTNNLIGNPSAESTINAVAGNWQLKGSATVTQSSTQSYNGANSLKVISTAVANDGVKQQLATTLAATTQYSASFYARLDSSSAMTAPATQNGMSTLVAGYSSTGASDDTPCTINVSATNPITASGWVKVTCNFTTPASPSSGNYFYIKQSDAKIYTFYVDAVLMQTDTNTQSNYREGGVSIQGAITSPVIFQNSANSTTALTVQNAAGSNIFNIDTTDTNLITNPGFELNTTGWAVRLGTGSISRDNSQSWLGNASLNITTSATANAGAKFVTGNVQPTQLAVSTQYTFSWYAKLSSSTFTDILARYSVDGGTTFINCTPSSQTVSTSGWTRYSCTFTTAVTTPGSTAFIDIEQTAGTARTFWIDGVQLEGGATATAYGAGTFFLNGLISSPTIFRNQSNSTNAFTIQDTTSAALINVDTLNSAVTVGSSAGTGTLTFGSSSAAQTVILGGGAGTSTVQIAGGTAANVITIGNAQTGGSISLGNLMTSGTINIGGGSAVRTGNIVIGSTGTTSGVLKLIGGTGTGLFGGSTSGIDIIPGVAGTINIGASAGAGTGTITLGQSTATQIVNIANGVTGVGSTKTVNIGTAQNASTGVTAINIGLNNSGTGVNTVTIKAGGNSISHGPSVTLLANGGGTAICASGLAAATAPTAGTAYELSDCSTAPTADFAEMYPAANGLEVGDIITLGTQQVQTYNSDQYGKVDWNSPKGTISQVVKATSAYDSNIIGVVSDNYSNFASTGYNIKQVDNPMSVALVGRLPIKVTNENGPIAVGDFLTSSSTHPGYAMKATKAGYVIGQALAAFSGSSTGTTMTFIRPQYYPGPTGIDLIQNGGDANIANLTVNGNTALTNLAVSGDSSFANINVNGVATFHNLHVVGSATIGTLTVVNSITTKDLKVTGDTQVQTITIGDGITLGVSTEDPTTPTAHAITKAFKASKAILAGSVVILDVTAGNGWVTTTTQAGSKLVIGIATTASTNNGDTIQVAIGGTAKVSLAGTAAIGDLVHTDAIEGKVSTMANSTPGEGVGKIISTPDTNGQVLILVTLQ